VPFDFLKRNKAPDPAPEPEPPPPVAIKGIGFEGMTEDWRLSGRMLVEGRLSDVLNRREAIEIVDVSWAPIDGSEPMVPAPGLKSVDPYDLVIVLAGEDSLPERSDESRVAQRVHKVAYEVAIEAPPYRVVGTIQLYPGFDPQSLLVRSSEMFVPVVDATATMLGRPIGAGLSPAILVNRQYVRAVEQVDARTGEPHGKLPGSSMGGVNLSD
jgi:hypothetical protein